MRLIELTSKIASRWLLGQASAHSCRHALQCQAVRLLSRRALYGTSTITSWKSTININKSVEFGAVIPNINVEDVATSSLIGKRDHQEDRCHVERLTDDILFFGVFDGHGGSLAVDFTCQHMADVMRSIIIKNASDVNIMLENAFCEVNNLLLQYIRKNRPQKERYSGTTATVCLLIDNIHLHTANVGDSRAVLCRRGQAVPLTTDHNPDREDERKRVEKEGGTIISNSLGEPQVNGRLSMTRSIGDFDLKPYGVTSVPEYCYTKVDIIDTIKVNHSTDTFVTLITDGVTFSMTNQEIVNVISSCKTASGSAELVTESALQLRSHDNSTAVVLPLGSWGQYKPEDPDFNFQVGRMLTSRD